MSRTPYDSQEHIAESLHRIAAFLENLPCKEHAISLVLGKAAFGEDEVDKRVREVTLGELVLHRRTGVPILSLEKKLTALIYCIERTLWEDAHGHLEDLLSHAKKRFGV